MNPHVSMVSLRVQVLASDRVDEVLELCIDHNGEDTNRKPLPLEERTDSDFEKHLIPNGEVAETQS